jgi:rhodanese-related sulfurtransferase
MPSIAHPDDLTAVIGFTLPAERLDHDPEVYLTYDKTRSRPTETVRVSVRNLRPDIEDPALPAPRAQLDAKGYAMARDAYEHLDDIPSELGTKAYLDDTAEWVVHCEHGGCADCAGR